MSDNCNTSMKTVARKVWIEWIKFWMDLSKIIHDRWIHYEVSLYSRQKVIKYG
jgi:hypothetical protein